MRIICVMILQAALEKEKNVSEVEDSGKQESLEALTSQVNRLALQDSPQAQDIDKRIRALKKKVRNLCFHSYFFSITSDCWHSNEIWSTLLNCF